MEKILSVINSAFDNASFWPSAAVVVLALIFRGALSNLFGRVAKVDKGGITLFPGLARQDADAKRENSSTEKQSSVKTAEELLKSFNNSLVLTIFEDSIKADIEKHNLKADDKTVELLVRNLAMEQIKVLFLEIYSVIYGSQMRLMRAILEQPGHRVSKSDIDRHVQVVKEQFPNLFKNSGWGTAHYLGYLLAMNLIGEEKGDVYITPCGTEFLAWVLKSGRTENKWG